MRVVAETVTGPDRDLRLAVEGDAGVLPGDLATPLAVVLNELMQNAVDHAFTGVDGRTTGNICVQLAREDGQLVVDVVDDGVGLPPGFSVEQSGRARAVDRAHAGHQRARRHDRAAQRLRDARAPHGAAAEDRATSFSGARSERARSRAMDQLATRRCLASQALRSLRRSSSVVPPQIPASWLVASANSRHSSFTAQAVQMRRAVSICSRAGPLLPMGKKTSGSESRQAERVRHALTSQSCVRTQVSATHSSGRSRLVDRRSGVLGQNLEALQETRLLSLGGAAQGADQEFLAIRPRRDFGRGIVSPMLVLAHRGANRLAPENTVAAMTRAMELGADGVELDVHRTADDHLVVRHDASSPTGVLGDLPAGQIRSALPQVPTLAEVLDVCQGGLVNVEIKNLPRDPDWDPTDRAAELLVGLLGMPGAGRRRDRVLLPPADDRPGAGPGPAGAHRPPDVGADPLEALVTAEAHGHAALHPVVWSLGGPLLGALTQRARERGLRVNVWTVNDPTRCVASRPPASTPSSPTIPDLYRRQLNARLSGHDEGRVSGS